MCEVLDFVADEDDFFDACVDVVVVDLADLALNVFSDDFGGANAGVDLLGEWSACAVNSKAVVAVV